MLRNNIRMQLLLLTLMLFSLMDKVATYKLNYEATSKYTKANVPLWKQRACEKAQKYKANSHYVCDDKDDVKCLPGWQGDLCQVPMCRKGCDPMNGYCQRPGVCRCRIGYTGELCDKCIPLPGCQHGDCTKPFECICRPGWDGLFCTEPTCRQGCHNNRGYCETPGECRCRIGWAGRNCSDCSVLPGCQYGTCTKPLECQCLPGYTGLLCQTPICDAACHKQHGYCKKPGECRCKVGWTGNNCDKCFPYPGCVNGDCEKPWECNCKPGWDGILCDEKLTYCKEHPNICENKGKCISLTKDDGSYRCHCKQGYLGKNCEIVDEFLLTSTAAPRITPPTLYNWDKDEDEDNNATLNNELPSNLGFREKETDLVVFTKNESLKEIKGIEKLNVATTVKSENVTFNMINSNSLANVAKNNSTKEKLVPKQDNVWNATADNTNNTVEYISLPTFTQATDFIIKDTATSISNLSRLNETKMSTSKINISTTTSIYTTITAPTTSSIETTIKTSTTTTISPLNKLDDERNLLSIPLKQLETNKTQDKEDDDDDDQDEDEECTDDNDEECEYVDEDDDEDFK